jgi:hypothetical protein
VVVGYLFWSGNPQLRQLPSWTSDLAVRGINEPNSTPLVRDVRVTVAVLFVVVLVIGIFWWRKRGGEQKQMERLS